MFTYLSRYKSIVLALLIGSFMALGAYLVIKYYEESQQLDRFNSTFSDKVTGLSQSIVAIEKVLIATQHMLEVYPDLNQQEFAHLVKDDLLSGTSITGIEWAPKIAIDQVAEFVSRKQQAGVFDYQIHNFPNGNPCVHSATSHWYIVALAEPSDKLGHELGLNFSSDCEMSTSMALALQQNKITSNQFTSDNGELGIRLFLPVHSNGEFSGYIVGLVMMNELVDSLWGELTQSKNYVLTIYNDVKKQNKLYDSQWQTDCSDKTECFDSNVFHSKSVHLPFANQLWHISFSESQQQGSSLVYASLAAFLIFLVTISLSYYLFTSINRFQWANKLVEEKTATLRFQASHDELTSLLNKTSLFSYLNKFIEQKKHGQFLGFSILFIDLDHFKKINDTMGHLVGDQLLKMMSQRLQNNSRHKDLLFRFGGDEFVIVLPELTNEHQVIKIAERYLEHCKQSFHILGQDYRISASVGVSVVVEPNITADDILRHADIAMYQAKDRGRGQVLFFRHQMQEQLMMEHRFESDLSQAIDLDQFVIYLQPIVDSCEKLQGFEALVRWAHPIQGLVMPLDFIPLIEKTNKINRFGELVAKKVMRQLNELYVKYGDKCPYISINISPLQLLDDRIITLLEEQLQHYRLPARLVAIELTESALIENHALVKKHLSRLNHLGVKLFLDDFGTGYSSLSLLQHFPINVIKIDRSFILELNSNKVEAKNLVKGIINMAKALNMNVVAEGIENKQVMEQLINNGCDSYQGYMFSKPFSQLDVFNYLEKHDLNVNRQKAHLAPTVSRIEQAKLLSV